ncbi:YncE family protein [Plastoroseomonas hellenica]|uniref:YncE family protein n=1 Tax=Plastoroseomonas hellenica TaxID=2687306 RepID=UPI001BAB3B22|nr:hypothetical protein [Plastoroseomonas hellenica]MBR0646764.1 hypothetical protein [Plastoroseomonas hellenica]
MIVDEVAQRRLPADHPVRHPSQSRAALRIAWAVLRLPAFLILLFLCKDWILATLIDPARITLLVIGIAGTPLARVGVFGATLLVLALIWLGARRLGPVRGYGVMMLLAAALAVTVFRLTRTPLWLAAPAILLLATNLLPDAIHDRILRRPRQHGAMAMAVGVAELFFLRRYLAWGFGIRVAAAGPALLLASGAAALGIGGAALTPIEQALRMPPSARVLALGDFNWIELDRSGQHLFVTGHGLPQLLRVAVGNRAEPSLASSAPTGGAQAFAYDAAAREIYVFNEGTRTLLTLDAETLELKRSLPLPDLSPGDPWIAVDPGTDTLVIVSEADDEVGTPFMVLDRTTGEVRDRRDLDAGNLLLRPDASRLYLSFFRRRGMLMAYDLRTRSIVAEMPAPPRVDRMAYLPASDEILLANPVASRIERFDAATLAPRGHIEAIFGVRVMALDEQRGILFCASLATGEVAAIDLATGRRMGRFYLGPWLRTIQVDPARATVYASSRGGLYELGYGQLR